MLKTAVEFGPNRKTEHDLANSENNYKPNPRCTLHLLGHSILLRTELAPMAGPSPEWRRALGRSTCRLERNQKSQMEGEDPGQRPGHSDYLG